MRLSHAPGSRSPRSRCEVSQRAAADGLSRAIGPRSPPALACTFQTALVLLPPIKGRQPIYSAYSHRATLRLYHFRRYPSVSDAAAQPQKADPVLSRSVPGLSGAEVKTKATLAGPWCIKGFRVA
jgi:hypothetical protein